MVSNVSDKLEMLGTPRWPKSGFQVPTETKKEKSKMEFSGALLVLEVMYG